MAAEGPIPTPAMLQAGIDDIKKIQGEIGKLVGDRTQYESQLNETGMCKDELDAVDDETAVYKMVGPVLVKQDPEEAKANVAKRLEFIQGEMARLDKALDEKQAGMEKKRQQVMEMQARFRKLSEGGAGGAGAGAGSA